MIDFAAVMGIARSEARLTRRLARYWVFQVIALLAAFAIYGWYTFLHWLASSFSGTVALIGPRFLFSFIGNWSVLVLCAGIVFLAFDIRARETKERMVEVVDSLPCSNVELVLGKFLGLVFACWVPTVVMAGLMWAVSLIVGAPVQGLGVPRFTIFLVIPAFAVAAGLTYLLTLLVRNRLIAAILALAVLVAFVWVNGWTVPVWASPLTDVTGATSIAFPSDLMPRLIDSIGLMQRVACLLVGLGLVGLAAAVHPRLDGGSRVVRAGAGGALVVAGVAVLTALSLGGKSIVDARVAWRAAHEAVAGEPAPDVRSLAGTVAIDPGDRLDLDLRIEFAAPADAALDVARFTLNPGLEVESIEGPRGRFRSTAATGWSRSSCPAGSPRASRCRRRGRSAARRTSASPTSTRRSTC